MKLFVRSLFEVSGRNSNVVMNPSQNSIVVRYCTCGDKTALTVALLGEPNAGKSTLVNNIVGQKVSAVSHIAHTTRTFTNGIFSIGNTQLVFTDTPGVISHHEGRRLKMDQNHIRDPRRVAGSADVLAVITDVSFRKTKDFIDETILSILHQHQEIPSILIMNKVDLLKRKEDLLFLATLLTQDRQKDEWGYKPYGGYSKFSEVFMTSAKTGDGVDDVVNYLISKATPQDWSYSPEVFTDASVGKQISEIFRESLLLLFAQEIPWQVKQVGVLRRCKFTKFDTCFVTMLPSVNNMVVPKQRQVR